MMLSGVSHFLRMFAARAIPPHTACFGADPRAIKSLLRGACTALRAPRCDGLRLRCRLKVFHWGKEGAAHDPAMSERCLTRYKDYADEFVDKDGTRRAWREAVDGMVRAAVAAGGRIHSEAKDHGFMYIHGFQDPDGHLWELTHMVPGATP